MAFVTSNIGDSVLNELQNASEVKLAVAYFNPDRSVLDALCKIPKLQLVISEEFTINDPENLETLSQTATIRSVPTDSENGKLHAKVLGVKRRDGSQWVLVGSANVTWQGLFSNQEACISLESRNVSDRTQIAEVVSWFHVLFESARQLNLAAAWREFNARSQYRFERRPSSQSDTCYWALKSTEGPYGLDHWPDFVDDSVIAIGWSGLSVNPSTASFNDLVSAVGRDFPYSETEETGEANPNGVANMMKAFVGLKTDDIVLICRGYPPNSDVSVHIRGFARVTGPFYVDTSPVWNWRFKHPAVLQVVDRSLPKAVVARDLEKGSLMRTIQTISLQGLENLARSLGVSVQV